MRPGLAESEEILIGERVAGCRGQSGDTARERLCLFDRVTVRGEDCGAGVRGGAVRIVCHMASGNDEVCGDWSGEQCASLNGTPSPRAPGVTVEEDICRGCR